MSRDTHPRSRVTPFWHRLPQFFVYPFHPRALIMLIGLTVIMAVTGGIAPIGGILVTLVATLMATKYAFDILARTAEGRLDPPLLDAETLLRGYGVPFKQVAVYIVIGGTTAIVGKVFGVWLALGFLAAALILLPASIMTLAFTGSLVSAIDPGTLLRTVRGTGWGYAALLGCLFLLNGGSSTALQWVGTGLPPAQLMVLSTLVQFYFTFVMFNLMGYLLYQYHDRLGYEPEAVAEQSAQIDPERQTIQAFIDDGNYAAAIEELKKVLRRDQDPDTRLWLHRVANMAGDEATLMTNAGPLIETLIDRGRIRDATDVYRSCQDHDPEARPARPTDYLPMAQMMVQAGQPQRALKLANGFHRNFPDHPDVPALYLLVARILADTGGQPEQARKVLTYIARRFPEQPEARQAESLRAALMP